MLKNNVTETRKELIMHTWQIFFFISMINQPLVYEKKKIVMIETIHWHILSFLL